MTTAAVMLKPIIGPARKPSKTAANIAAPEKSENSRGGEKDLQERKSQSQGKQADRPDPNFH